MNYKTRQPFPHAAYVEGQRNFTYFDRSLTSGLTDVVIESPGDFLYIDQASTGVVSVELNMRQGGTLAPILLAAGGSIECDFASIKLNATAQLNKSVRIIVGNGARIKGGATVEPESGVVSAVNGGYVYSLNEQAYGGSLFPGAVAANSSHVQLWNPANSGKNFYCSQVRFNSNIAGQINISYYNAAYTTTGGVVIPKKLGGAASVALINSQHSAALLQTAIHSQYNTAANQLVQLDFAEPFIIPPGKALCVINQVQNAALSANFDWVEK